MEILGKFGFQIIINCQFCRAEEVFLENVELILEAFDYLELPVSLKHGKSLFNLLH